MIRKSINTLLEHLQSVVGEAIEARLRDLLSLEITEIREDKIVPGLLFLIGRMWWGDEPHQGTFSMPFRFSATPKAVVFCDESGEEFVPLLMEDNDAERPSGAITE